MSQVWPQAKQRLHQLPPCCVIRNAFAKLCNGSSPVMGINVPCVPRKEQQSRPAGASYPQRRGPRRHVRGSRPAPPTGTGSRPVQVDPLVAEPPTATSAGSTRGRSLVRQAPADAEWAAPPSRRRRVRRAILNTCTGTGWVEICRPVNHVRKVRCHFQWSGNSTNLTETAFQKMAAIVAGLRVGDRYHPAGCWHRLRPARWSSVGSSFSGRQVWARVPAT